MLSWIYLPFLRFYKPHTIDRKETTIDRKRQFDNFDIKHVYILICMYVHLLINVINSIVLEFSKYC